MLTPDQLAGLEEVEREHISALLNPTSEAGKRLSATVEAVLLPRSLAAHHPSCYFVGPSDATVQLSVAGVFHSRVETCCEDYFDDTLLIGLLEWTYDALRQDEILPTFIEVRQALTLPHMVDGLEVLVPLVEASWKRARSFHERVRPHAEAILDVMSSVAQFDRSAHPGDLAVGALFLVKDELLATGADPFLLEVLEERYTGTGSEEDHERAAALLTHHLGRTRTTGCFLVSAPDPLVYTGGLSHGYFGHAVDSFTVPGHRDVALVPGSARPLFELVPGVDVLPATGVTPEVLEAFVTLKHDRPGAAALEQALAL
jgi:hypothetical protein